MPSNHTHCVCAFQSLSSYLQISINQKREKEKEKSLSFPANSYSFFRLLHIHRYIYIHIYKGSKIPTPYVYVGQWYVWEMGNEDRDRLGFEGLSLKPYHTFIFLSIYTLLGSLISCPLRWPLITRIQCKLDYLRECVWMYDVESRFIYYMLARARAGLFLSNNLYTISFLSYMFTKKKIVW